MVRKIINGKKYDTDTAQFIGENRSNVAVNDFRYFRECLYRKKTGEYFLAGEGGPASKYCKPDIGSGWTGGEAITPLSEEEAREWAEKYLSVDEYEAEFGIVEEELEVDPVLQKVGRNIRRAREAAGLTQAEAAKRIGTVQQAWARYENGQVAPSVSRLLQIADILGVKTSEL